MTGDAAGWPVGFRIRPGVDVASPDLEVTDTVSGRRFRWSPESLCDYILNDRPADGHDGWARALEQARDRDELVPGWRHWHERGWYPSDQYYVASRRWAYADTYDPDGDTREAVLGRYLAADGPPIEEYRPDGTTVPLPAPAPPGDQRVARLLVTRRTGRAFVPKPVPAGSLSGLLWHGLAEVRAKRARTGPADRMSYLDSHGSAWDFYLCVYNVAGLEPGAYRYDVCAHELIAVHPGDHRDAMCDVLQGMHTPTTAAWTLGLVADFPRYQWRYRHEHGLRRLYLESGVLGQELVILGMSYGLGTLVTPAQKDRAYLAVHRLPDDGRFAPVYTLTMGRSLGRAGTAMNGREIIARDAR